MKIGAIRRGALDELVDHPGIQAQVRVGAEVVAGDAAGRAPVDTGTLQGRIGVRASRRGYRVVADVDYSWFVEYGTLHQPGGQPFLRPAVESFNRRRI